MIVGFALSPLFELATHFIDHLFSSVKEITFFVAHVLLLIFFENYVHLILSA